MTHKYINILRKIVRVGNAYYVNLPLKFINKHGLSKGDKVLIHGSNALTIQVIDTGITPTTQEISTHGKPQR